MPPPRNRQRPRFRLSNYDRELLQAVHDRRLDRDDPEVQAVLQRVEQAPAGEPWQTASVSMQPEAPPPPSQFESDLAMTRAGQAGREGVVSLLPRSYSLFDEPAAENRPSPRPDHYTVPDLGRDVLNVATSVATQPIGDNPYSPDVQDALREQGLPTDPRISPWGGIEAATGALPATAGALFDLATGETDPDIPDLVNNPPTWRSIAEARDAPEWLQTGATMADLLVGPEDLVFPGSSAVLGAALGTGRLLRRTVKAATETGSAASRGIRARRLLKTMGEPDRALVAQEIAAQFPRVDAYTKLNRHLSQNMLDARLSSPEGLSPVTQQFVRAIRDTIDEPIAPMELQALALGADYVPSRRVRRGHTRSDTPDPVNAPSRARRYQGAPSDVATAAHERTRLNHYLALAREGEKGADWYDTSGAATLFAMGDDVPRAREMADVVAVTSPATMVDVNTGFALQGVEQLESGIPVSTGRFPARDSAAVQALREGGEVTGQKRLPFSQQIQLGGGFSEVDSPRSVHDIWDMEAWGYQNADGSPLRAGASSTQHRWMDSMTEKAIAKANRENLSGRSDWTTGHLQAAAWTGSKIRAGKLKPGANVVDIASAFKKREMQLSREAIPGRTAQHLEGLEGDALEDYARDQFDIDTDPQGRSRLAVEGRVPVGTRSGEGPGVYQGETSRGYQASIVAGHSPAPGGGTEVFPPTMARATRIEGGYAWLHSQDAGAGSRLTQFPTEKEYNAIVASEPDIYKRPMRGAELTLGRTPTVAEMQQADAIMTRAAGANDAVAVVFIPGQGLRLGNLPESKLNLKQFDAASRQVAKALQAKRENGRFSSFYIDNDWGQKTLGQEYWQYLPEPGSRAERELQRQTTLVRKRDATEAVRNPSVTTNPLIQEIRAVYEEGGLSAMQAFATKRGLPLTAVLAALGVGAQSQASDGGPLRRS